MNEVQDEQKWFVEKSFVGRQHFVSRHIDISPSMGWFKWLGRIRSVYRFEFVADHWAMLYLRQLQSVSEKVVSQRIKAEYPPELQPYVFETYRHLKIKELEGLFLKILDDSKGDLEKVKKLASVAENVGWQAFLENKW